MGMPGPAINGRLYTEPAINGRPDTKPAINGRRRKCRDRRLMDGVPYQKILENFPSMSFREVEGAS